MSYKFQRALGMALALYLSTFVVGIVAGLVSGQDMSSMTNIADAFWYVGMVAAVVLTAGFSLWYFKNAKIIPSAKAGFYFGVTVVIVSFVLDFVLFSLGNTQGAEVDLGRYYGDFRFWVILVLVIVTAKIVGHIKKPKTL